jgi:hypothetical protein
VKIGDSFPQFGFFASFNFCGNEEIQFWVTPQVCQHNISGQIIGSQNCPDEEMLISFKFDEQCCLSFFPEDTMSITWFSMLWIVLITIQTTIIFRDSKGASLTKTDPGTELG